MSRSLNDVLFQFYDLYSNVPESKEVQSTFISLQRVAVDSIFKRDFRAAEEIREHLDMELAGADATDLKSYHLGKVHALIDMIALFGGQHEVEVKTDAVERFSDREYEVLKVIYEEHEATPSEIGDTTGLRKNHVSNLLTSLLQRGFVRAEQFGRNRVYSLSTVGRQVFATVEERKHRKENEKRIEARLLAEKTMEMEQRLREQLRAEIREEVEREYEARAKEIALGTYRPREGFFEQQQIFVSSTVPTVDLQCTIQAAKEVASIHTGWRLKGTEPQLSMFSEETIEFASLVEEDDPILEVRLVDQFANLHIK